MSKPVTHKVYINELISTLLALAMAEETATTRRTAAIGGTPTSSTCKKRKKHMGTVNPMMNPQHFERLKSKHMHVRAPIQCGS